MIAIDRRSVVAGLGGLLAAEPPRAAAGSRRTNSLLFFNAVGDVLTSHTIDFATAAQTPRGSVTLGGNIQFAWRHSAANLIYAITSVAGPNGPHLIHAVRFTAKGMLQTVGAPASMPSRANHMSLHGSGRFILSAHPNPCELMVHRINPDFSVGERVEQSAKIDFGLYAHQARTMPSGRSVILVCRGDDAADGKPENPGSLRQFDFDQGRLTPRAVIAPDGGYGFGARDVDFHPGGKWLCASLERQNKLYVFALDGDRIDPTPRFVKETLEDPAQAGPGQIAGDLHFHPDGRSLYLANRGNLDDVEGKGESNIARFMFDPATGEPVLAASSDTLGFHPRTFAIDPGARLLIAANVRAYRIMDRGKPHMRPPSLTTYRIGADGALNAIATRDIEAAAGVQQFWCGFAAAD